MQRILIAFIAVGSAMSVRPSARPTFDPPKVNLITQNTRTAPWAVVPRATVAQQSSRRVRLSGPWVGFGASVVPKNGVSARNIKKITDNQLELILDATTSATRGDVTLQLNIICPGSLFPTDCKGYTTFPVKVFETGPIKSIQPFGVVQPNTKYTFELTGEALDVAVLLPRLVKLGSATILSKTATTMKVVGTTPSCGYIDVALTDVADGDENPYRHATTMQSVLAGTICGQSLAPTNLKYHQCTPPQVWDDNIKACKNP